MGLCTLSGSAPEFLETGQNVRWRGRRWRVLSEERNGLIELVGLDAANRDQVVTPLFDLEREAIEPDALPPLSLEVDATDRGQWRALHMAHLTTMAGGREQLRGLDWGAVTVEPYQVVPLMRVAKTVRPRLLIADDMGLGKTAEAGLIVRWLAQRHQAGRVLVVTRATPEPERWKRELWLKFGFEFDILKNGADFMARRRETPTVNVFARKPRLIVSMALAAGQMFLDEIRQCPTPFDVIVVDEAHHLAERGSRTKRLTLLGRRLSELCPDGTFLLLTATPHDGKTESFLSLLRLLDPLVDFGAGDVPVDVASRLVVRRLKPEVTLAGGKRFIEPKIHLQSTLREAIPAEKAVEEPLNRYLEWLAAEEARYADEGARQKAKGCEFLTTVYRKRLGSSVAALRATLRRRLGLPPAEEDTDTRVPFVNTDAPDPEDEIIDPGAGSESPPPPLAHAERALAMAVLDASEKVPHGRDSKLQALVRLLNAEVSGEKVVVFTEYRDTLRAAARRLESEGISFVTFHGDTPEGDRDDIISAFIHDPEIRVFLATDAASEGKNLQHGAHHLIHLDVPWNPNRYAQRNGRIDRYGQNRAPNIWVLVSADRKRGEGRPEYRALEVVIEKLHRIRRQVGSATRVLPRQTARSVAEVLAQASATAEQEMDELLTDETIEAGETDLSRLSVTNQRELTEAERFVQSLGSTDDFSPIVRPLLETAFRAWDDGGRLEELETGVFRVRIPARLRDAQRRQEIERATFRRDLAVAGQDEKDAHAQEFLSPAHPLVESVLRRLRDDATNPSFIHRFDVSAGHPDGLVLSFALRFVDGEGRTVDERLEAVEVSLDGDVSHSLEADLHRLGIDEAGASVIPDRAAIGRWQKAFVRLAAQARDEAERRAGKRRSELEDLGRGLREDELANLALWRRLEEQRIETLTLGTSAQVSFETGQEYEERMSRLDDEYEARRALVRDRSEVRLVGLELIGGRLIVPAAS